jgi:hypothetical protein
MPEVRKETIRQTHAEQSRISRIDREKKEQFNETQAKWKSTVQRKNQ